MNSAFPFEGKPGYLAAVQVARHLSQVVYGPHDALHVQNAAATSLDLVLCMSQAWMGDPNGPFQARMVAAKVQAFLDASSLERRTDLSRSLHTVLQEADALALQHAHEVDPVFVN